MQIVVAGSHGLLGSALVEHLTTHGHHVRRLVRGAARSATDITWHPPAGHIDAQALRGADAVVNLGGAGLGDKRWDDAYRRVILRSRTAPTALLARTLAELDDGPRVLLQGTAVGYYGDRGDEVLTEDSGPGRDFLAGVVQAWERATSPAVEAGVRVAHLRTGIVMSRTGGSFGRLLPLLRLGLGGPLGPGDNYWAWITLVDHVRAVEHLLGTEVEGPVNLTAPAPAPQGEIVRALASALHRPAVLRVPQLALRVVLGEFARDILASQRALPQVLTRSGFRHRHPDLASAAAWVTSRDG
ncbi:TIGR01777 family protein [Cellulomonas sp. APG4]|uniref:TIGR01777 family oxidoreductase n=1 Tax=Cellulomonas sp. APG4 TaxID=1538656 RepID=UPI00137B7E49|nr:TIGR01777 family oxidoreductase [Cellulomonas sp. APG4]NCT90060.1 TIGR01777 family protein [Cellulomonas sp. APG4]